MSVIFELMSTDRRWIDEVETRIVARQTRNPTGNQRACCHICYVLFIGPAIGVTWLTNLAITGILPLVHLITPAPHTPPIKQAQRMHQFTRSQYTKPGKRTIHIPVQHHDTPICIPQSHIHTRSHLGLLHNTTQKRH